MAWDHGSDGRRLQADDHADGDATRSQLERVADSLAAFWREVGLDIAELSTLDRNHGYLAWVIEGLRRHEVSRAAARHVVAQLALPIARSMQDGFLYREDEFGFYVLAYQATELSQIRQWRRPVW